MKDLISYIAKALVDNPEEVALRKWRENKPPLLN